jgi:hypothetical protein
MLKQKLLNRAKMRLFILLQSRCESEGERLLLLWRRLRPRLDAVSTMQRVAPSQWAGVGAMQLFGSKNVFEAEAESGLSAECKPTVRNFL